MIMKIIDLEKMILMHSVVFKEAWDIKLHSGMLLIATNQGVYRLNANELISIIGG